MAELEEAGYLTHEKVGRRNHYEVKPETPLRHPLEDHVPIGDILQTLGARLTR